MDTPLHGLLLAGGKSRRMGTDKADLVVHDGLSLRDRGLQLLQSATDAPFLSIAADDDRSYSVTTLRDQREDAGPLAGIEAAFLHTPETPWLVAACDLPFLTREVLLHLVNHRDSSADATCFTSRFDGKPEPLCTIYEPAAAPKLKTALDNNIRCARKFLFSLERHEIELPQAMALDNCNRPEDLEEARLRKKQGDITKTIQVDYCGSLHDQAGTRSESVRTEAATAAGLWEELRMKNRFSLEIDSVRVAINDCLQPWTHPLADQDRVVLFPPYAGG